MPDPTHDELEQAYQLACATVRARSDVIRAQVAEQSDAAALVWGAYIAARAAGTLSSKRWFLDKFNAWLVASRAERTAYHATRISGIF